MSRAAGPWTGILLLGGALLVATAFGAQALSRWEHGRVVDLALAQALVYAGAGWLLLRSEHGAAPSWAPPFALAGILVLGALMRLLVLFEPPVSTDVFRYVWDGRVQGAGMNPYLYIPADAALAHLRDEVIYPHINRKDYAPTIYPPAAQIVFFLATRIGESVTVMKAVMVAFEGLGVLAILKLLAARGLPATRILLYVWHPLPIYEFAGSGHVDAIAIAGLMLAFWAAERRSPLLAGAALAAGVFAKYFPMVAGPALWSRWDWRLPAAFAATAILFYMPYLSAGAALLGFLGGYLDEGGLASGSGLYLWSLARLALPLPASAALYLPLAAILLALVALRLIFTRQGSGPDLWGGMVLALVFTVLFSPHHAWYFAWAIPFLCFHPSAAVIYVTGASSSLLKLGWPPDVAGASILYGPFAALLLVEIGLRRTGMKEWRHGRA